MFGRIVSQVPFFTGYLGYEGLHVTGGFKPHVEPLPPHIPPWPKSPNSPPPPRHLSRHPPTSLAINLPKTLGRLDRCGGLAQVSCTRSRNSTQRTCLSFKKGRFRVDKKNIQIHPQLKRSGTSWLMTDPCNGLIFARRVHERYLVLQQTQGTTYQVITVE